MTPAEPGFARVAVGPQPGELAWARGTVPTPRGDITATWMKSAAAFSLDLTTPAGMSADVKLPVEAGAIGELLVDGQRLKGTPTFVLQPGAHHIVVRLRN